MKRATYELLKVAKELCDEEDRSTEYMLQFMQDFARVDLDCVLKFLKMEAEKEAKK